MKVLFTGGGTGGHVYPALSVIERLRQDPHYGVGSDDIAWVGRGNSMEQDIVERQGLRFLSIDSGPLRGRLPWQAAGSLVHVGRGVRQGWQLLKQWEADAVFATGGYVSAPLVLAAWLRKCPVMIYLPDVEPGLAVRFMSRIARRIAISFEHVSTHFDPHKVVVTGYPVRQELLGVSKAEARQRLGLVQEEPVVLILGGSSGARSINNAVSTHLEGLLTVAQIIHVSGAAHYDSLTNRADQLGNGLRSRYHLAGYLHDEMIDALGAADLVVARAGAATLGEFPAAGLAAVLVPLPISGQHQRPNAEYMTERGAGIILDDADLSMQLLDTVHTLLGDPARLEAMSAASRRMAKPDAADHLARTLVALARGTDHE